MHWKSNLTIAAISALLGTALVAAPIHARELRFNGWPPLTHPLMKLSLMPWAKQVEEVTHGRVKIMFTPASVVPPPAQFDAVASGAIDMAVNVSGFTPARFKAGVIAEMPFLAKDAEPLSVALWRTHEKFLVKADEYKGVKVLTRFAGTPGYLWSINKQIRSVEDFKGLKVFCGLRAPCEIAQILGAIAIARPGPEVTEVVERSIVDANFSDAGGYKSFRLERFIKSVVVPPTGFFAPTFYVIVNEKAWNEISPEDKKAIETISGEALARKVGSDWDNEAVEAFTLAREKKVEFIHPEGIYWSALQKLLVPPAEELFYKNAGEVSVDGRAALAYLREQVAIEQKAKDARK